MDRAPVAGRRRMARRSSPSASPDVRSAAARWARSPRSPSPARSGTPAMAQIRDARLRDSRSFSTLAFAAFVIAQRPGTADRTRARVDAARRGRRWRARPCRRGRSASCCPLGTLVAYTVAQLRDFAMWRRLHLMSGFALYLAPDRAVVRRVASANHEFLKFFFVHEQFQRFLTEEHQRTGAVVLLHSARGRRQLAVAGRCSPMGARATWRMAAPRQADLFVAAIGARLGRVRVRVLQRCRGRSSRPTSCRCSHRWRWWPATCC